MERTLTAPLLDTAASSAQPYLSVFIPARNEAGNVPPLMEKLARTFRAHALDAEVIFVDDGSTDATWNEAVAAAEQYPFVRLYRHRRSFGLTEAMRTGFRHVRGEVVVFLPADLESDPEEDIPKLLSKLDEGYDVVAGWRQGRNDGKMFASQVYNAVSRALFHLDAHDMNWIKAFRREVLDDLHLRSDWHRFILHIAAEKGYKIGEVPVNFYPRKKGKSNFGFARIPISFLDVLVVKFLMTFSRKPMLFFGGLGALAIISAFVIWGYLTILYFNTPGNMQQRPLFTFAGFILIAGILLFIGGFLAELVVSQSDRVEDMERALREREEEK
ncbi:MAG: glycosyltransferase family 2 protein [Anaerolineae bacterium]|nr:glycosyltransferase family 2 protein [Anaerolineae bacterium]